MINHILRYAKIRRGKCFIKKHDLGGGGFVNGNCHGFWIMSAIWRWLLLIDREKMPINSMGIQKHCS